MTDRVIDTQASLTARVRSAVFWRSGSQIVAQFPDLIEQWSMRVTLDPHVTQYCEAVERLRLDGVPAVAGDAADPEVLVQAHIATARMLVIATPDTVSVRRIAEIARTLNPAIEIAVRVHDEEEAHLLGTEEVGKVFFGERELALAMTRHVLARRGIDTSSVVAS